MSTMHLCLACGLVWLADSNSQMGRGIQESRRKTISGDVPGFFTVPSDGTECDSKREHCPAGAGLSRREKEMEANVAVDTSRCQNHAEDITSSWNATEPLI